MTHGRTTTVKASERRQARAGSASTSAANSLLQNETSLTSLAKGLDALNVGNNALLELAQQASAQIAQGGGSLREIEYANQLAVLSQRIAKNANALASSDEIDPEVAFLLGKDAGTFRDILNGLHKGQRNAAPAGRAQRRGADRRWPTCRSGSPPTRPASTRS